MSENLDFGRALELVKVRFHSGAVHRYDGVTAATFSQMMAAPSIGRHFAQHIKPHHPATKIS